MHSLGAYNGSERDFPCPSPLEKLQKRAGISARWWSRGVKLLEGNVDIVVAHAVLHLQKRFLLFVLVCVVQIMPEHVYYRQAVEAITQYRLNLVQDPSLNVRLLVLSVETAN